MPTSAALRQINQARILATLRTGSWSRVGLAERLGMNRSTATIIINTLLEQGFVREVDTVLAEPGSTGRPRVAVALNGSGAHFGGLEIGNQTLTAVVVDLNGRELGRASDSTRADDGPAAAEERLGTLLGQLLDQHPEAVLEGIGITIPGMVRPSGWMDWAPWLGWRDAQLGATTSALFSVPVYVENDANAAALAEEHLWPRDEGSSLVYVHLDSGVGVGILIDRELYRGATGRAGESGHTRLFPTAGGASAHTAEDLLGAQSVLASFSTALDDPTMTWPEVITAAEGHLRGTDQLVDRWQDTLGWLASTLAWTLDPDVVVFGGPAAALLRDDPSALQRSLRANGPRGLDQRWRLSRLADAVGIGATALPMRAFFAVPTF